MLTSRPTYRSADDGLDIIRTMREARFAHRVTCPHCGSALTVRWGGFAGRQRYRCKSCKRTFSDLTRTAFAYTKRIGSWPHYLVLVRQGRSLRAAAQQVGVHVSTAFRWRHSLLASMRAADSLVLDGTVELMEISFAHSMKGSRNLARPRLRGSRTAGWVWHEVPHDRVLLAISRSGGSDARTIGGDMVIISRVSDWARTRLADQCTILGRMSRMGPCAAPLHAAGHDYQALRHTIAGDTIDTRHTRNVEALARRLMAWLRRFRGVASKYRDNYLHWHRHADADTDLIWARAIAARSVWPNGGGWPNSGGTRRGSGGEWSNRPP